MVYTPPATSTSGRRRQQREKLLAAYNASSAAQQYNQQTSNNTQTSNQPNNQTNTSNVDVFGDVSFNPLASQTTTGLTTSTGQVASPTYQELGDLSVYWQTAKDREAQNAGTITQRNDIIAGNLLSEGKTAQEVQSFLESQQGFKDSTPEDQANTIRAIQTRMWEMWQIEPKAPEWHPWKYLKNGEWVDILWYWDLDPETQWLIDKMTDAEKKNLDMMRWADANAKAEYLRQAKREQEYAAKQRDYTIQIQDLQGNVLEIQSSQRIRDAGKQLENLKQNYAYLWQMGAPWVSSQRLDAIAWHIAEAEKKFMELKTIETKVAQIRELGLKVDTAAYEKQMADITDDLNMKVGMQIQNALNDMNAAEMAGELDTVDWVTQFRRSLLERLDNSISWYTQWSLQQMQYVTEQYDKIAQDAQLRLTEYTTNANTINQDMSIAQWYYVDGNGNPVIWQDGQQIAMPTKPPMDPVFDKESGKLITFATWADGQIVASVQQVYSWQWAMTDAKTAMDVMKAISAGELTSAQAVALFPSLASVINAETSWADWYTWPDYTPVDQVTVDSAIEWLTVWGNALANNPILQKAVNSLLQCGAGTNDYLNSLWFEGNMFVDPIDAKKAAMNRKVEEWATVWSVVVFDPTGTSWGNSQKEKFGFVAWHTAIVTAVDANGNPTRIADWNRSWDKRFKESDIPAGMVGSIAGYFDPTKAPQQATQESTTDYMYEDFTKGLEWQSLQAFNNMKDEDKSVISQLISWDALLTDIVKSRGAAGTKENKRLIDLARSVDPTFSLTTNKIRYKFRDNWDNDRVPWSIWSRTAINTSLGHLADLADKAKQLPAWTIGKMNSAENVLRTEFGDPAVTNFRINLEALATELARLYQGWVPSLTQIESRQENLAESFSQQQFEWAFDTAAELLSSKLTAMRYNYKSTMGREFNQTLIDPYKRQLLEEAGIDPSIIAKEDIGWDQEQLPTTFGGYAPR